MSTMFDEAIADAKKLKELAEQNAKNKIIDAMAPKIRSLIENELMGDEEIYGHIEDALDIEEDETDVDDSSQTVNINVDGDASIAVTTGDMEVENDTGDEEVDDDLLLNLNAESARALASLIRNPSRLNGPTGLSEALDKISGNVKVLQRLVKHIGNVGENSALRETVRKYYTQLIKEMISLRQDVILTEGTANTEEIRLKYNYIVKEIKKMSKRRTNTLFDRLFEGQYEGDHKDLDEFDVVFDEDDIEALGVEDSASLEDLDVDVVVQDEEGAAEEEVSDEVMEAYLQELLEQDEEVEVEEEEVEVEASPIEDVGEVVPVADIEDAIEDLGDALGLDVSAEAAGEEEIEIDVEEEEVLEIDEAVLRRELHRMRKLREQEEAVDTFVPSPAEDLGDVILDIDEEDLINALADELGPDDVPEPVVESRRQKRMNESRTNRALKRKLVEYRKAVGTLKTQLTEMNLFNAKLLYVNKLMQNRNLNTKQQRAIVEALDNAKTLREAKLLYKSLTTSLNKRSSKKSLAEGRNARTLGSSSRSIRSASATNNGNEVDRWAVLAGISNKN
tara:strand:+ start:48357 stop:50045 length:1689 start_codon:yes stop_codon:yes gene_type:complete